MNEQYFLIKNGYYYRPGSCGYTANPREAGIYTKEEADRHCECSEVKMIPVSQTFPSGKPQSYAELEAEIIRLKADLAPSGEDVRVSIERLKTVFRPKWLRDAIITLIHALEDRRCEIAGIKAEVSALREHIAQTANGVDVHLLDKAIRVLRTAVWRSEDMEQGYRMHAENIADAKEVIAEYEGVKIVEGK